MGKRRVLSLRALAARDNPFESKELKLIVEKRLSGENCEGRFLEWKLHGPFGSVVTKKAKYRIVKAIVSFANTDGGFVFFGVDNSGERVGLSDEEVSQFDPAKITELVNGCIWPDITEFNIYFFRWRKKQLIILHVPPSKVMPHVTTKEVLEATGGTKPRVLLAKYVVYCRFGGKTDVGKPADYQRMITRRTDVLRQSILSRFKEVTIAKPTGIEVGGRGASVLVRVAESTKDSSVPVVRVSRRAEGTGGILLHEELSEGLFDEINNVLDANKLLAGESKKFVLGLEVYYRIYAEREHVECSNEQVDLLACTGSAIYAPVWYWLLQLPCDRCAEMIREACSEPKAPGIYNIMRLAILLGPQVSMWVEDRLDEKWADQPQPPDYYRSFKKMVSSRVKERRLVALRTKGSLQIKCPDEERSVSIKHLLEDRGEALSLLCKYCLRVFKGRKEDKTICRILDVLGYGLEFQRRGEEVASMLS